MKLLGNTKSNTSKDKNAKNVPHLEITEFLPQLSTKFKSLTHISS